MLGIAKNDQEKSPQLHGLKYDLVAVSPDVSSLKIIPTQSLLVVYLKYRKQHVRYRRFR